MVELPNIIFEVDDYSIIKPSNNSSVDSNDSIDDLVSQWSLSPLSLQQFRRTRRQPSYLQEYHCQTAFHDPKISIGFREWYFPSTLYPLSHFLYFHRFSPSYEHFFLSISSHNEPKNFHPALKISKC